MQNPYGIDYRRVQDLFVRSCGEHGVAFVPFFAIAGAGRKAGVSGAERDEILAVARTHSATPAQIRLAWTLHQGPHVLAIPGTSNPDHLVANLAAGTLQLSPEELTQLDATDHG